MAAVRQVLEEGTKVSHVAKAFGILPTMLSRWVYECQTHREDAFSGNGVPIRQADSQIKRLQKQLEELEMENEILKMAGILEGAEAQYRFFRENAKTFKIKKVMCCLLRVSRQAYYDWC